MQLHLVLAHVEPASVTLPSMCPAPQCGGTAFRLHQQVTKPIQDVVYHSVAVSRYQCLRCARTFRVYPCGVTRASTSQRIQDVAVVLNLLGLSFGAVALALDALGVYLCKSRVYDAVQVARAVRPQLTRQIVFDAIQRRKQHDAPLLVKCMGHWLPLAVVTNGDSRLVLTVTPLIQTDIALLHDRISPVMLAMGGRMWVIDERAGGDAKHTCDQDTL